MEQGITINGITYRTGDILTARVHKLPFINHTGLIVIDPTTAQISVWHCTPNGFNSAGGSVHKTPLNDWTTTRTPLYTTRTPLTQEQIEAGAMKLYHKKFHYAFFNCEHFVSTITEGSPRSPQLQFWTILAGVSVTLYLVSRKHK